MANTSLTSRVIVIEERLNSLEEKIDTIIENINIVEDDTDQTKDDILKSIAEQSRVNSLVINSIHTQFSAQLKELAAKNEEMHVDLSKKVALTEKFQAKWTNIALGAIAIISIVTGHWATLVKIIGI